jgi:glutamate synthase domain-containing protein 2/glutamate synthase domain-containing protein 1/glutamate synthase domain-containing protein 3
MPGSSSSASCGVGFVCNIPGTKSHEIVSMGIEAVKNLTHRGAVGADGKSGDGAGILTQLPRRFLQKEMARLGFSIGNTDNLAAGSMFLYGNVEEGIEKAVKQFNLKHIGWRDVPVRENALGKSALLTRPRIRQMLIDTNAVPQAEREAILYLARRAVEKTFARSVYVCSLSSKTMVYKGMLVAPYLDEFYPDLRDEDFESAFCLFHQRFSTNTSPDWPLAQPFRTLAHNGEINTLQGNRNAMTALEHEIQHEIFGEKIDFLRPLIARDESDSASLDRIVELLVLSGYSPEHAVTLCIPPVWEHSDPDPDEKAFFEYHSLLMAPWDGPAAIAFTDGNVVGAHLDRNGLRPLRYVISRDGLLVLGSEIGMVDLGQRPIREKGRLGPGETVAVNLQTGAIKFTPEIVKDLAARRPYRVWLEKHHLKLTGDFLAEREIDRDIARKQVAFGFTAEEVQMQLGEMASTGKELIFSMGDDTPLPPLSEKPQLLFRYFKQRFSQVTNPPIDPIRERTVMSLRMDLGCKRNFLDQTPEHARRLGLESPVLSGKELPEIEKQRIFNRVKVPLTYARRQADLARAVAALQDQVVAAVTAGAEIVLLSDRDLSTDRTAIPSLLAISACFEALGRRRLANRASIIIETGEARDVHQVACLLGYGASAVYPWLSFETIGELCASGAVTLPYEEACRNYVKALEDGLLKVMARMGISTMASYQGAHIFDSICLKSDFVEEFFSGTPVQIESDGLPEIERSLLARHDAGFRGPSPSLEYGGALKYRKDGEWHGWSPQAVQALNQFMKSGDYSLYKEFSRKADERPVSIRQLLGCKKGSPLSLDQVEPEALILKRFFSGAMSVGALSPEAHETIAEACNTLGIKSNSGEGGEDPARYFTIKGSAIRQIASGRFGVTPTYLASAQDLEIKIAQGAKPGEGGHLPEIKVTEYIAKLRHCKPAMLLISPPPHHDIYSIEDLAQLIHDLKQANPQAHVCVKLVAETGVGTIAAGVAKAYADIVQISGCEGGTGAASITSIKNVGNHWELGLAETVRVLMENGLRDRIRVRVDGGMKTGRDVIIAALLGAEEFGFGTATMVSAGCIMARQCHRNTCPTGVATQDENLRKRFRGSVEGVTAYFRALAREVREIMAGMGVRGLAEIIGRTDLLIPVLSPVAPGSGRMNVSMLLREYPGEGSKYCTVDRNDNPAPSLNDRLVADLQEYIEKGEPVSIQYDIRNIHRSVPVKLSYVIARRYGEQGLPDDTLRLTFRGTAGQSFGAFNHRGLSLTLFGDANDYTGKGMFGGRIAIIPSDIEHEPHKHVIVGNTVLYGAIGGEFYAAGMAGERFAVRNSGANAVIEGTGHHLCEYMTRGTVVVLGEVGHNVGAGMTGGVIYILDRSNRLGNRINASYVRMEDVRNDEDIETLRSLVISHYRYTGSLQADEIVTDFKNNLRYFRKVVPV